MLHALIAALGAFGILASVVAKFAMLSRNRRRHRRRLYLVQQTIDDGGAPVRNLARSQHERDNRDVRTQVGTG